MIEYVHFKVPGISPCITYSIDTRRGTVTRWERHAEDDDRCYESTLLELLQALKYVDRIRLQKELTNGPDQDYCPAKYSASLV